MRYTIPVTLTVDADSPLQARNLADVELLSLALTVPRVIHAEIASVLAITESVSLADLVGEWNEVTDPSIPRTDAEHDAHRARAREIRAQIVARGYVEGVHYRETDDGRLRSFYSAGRV